MSQPISFEDWKAEVERILKERWGCIPSGMDWDTWREFFYDEGDSPLDAVLEEESCGQ